MEEVVLVKVKVLDCVIDNCINGSIIELEEGQANYYAGIGYVEIVDPATEINRIEQAVSGLAPLAEGNGTLTKASKQRMTNKPYVSRKRK